MAKGHYAFKIVLTGVITGICNGLFGAGGGIIAVPAMVHLLDFDEHDAHATAISVIFPLSVVSFFTYLKNGFFEWDFIWRVAIGSVLGGVIGAWLLHRVSEYWLRKIFAIFIIAAAIRMII